MQVKLILTLFACCKAVVSLENLKAMARHSFPKTKHAGFRGALFRTIQLGGCYYIRQHVAIYCLDKKVDNSGIHTKIKMPKK